LETINRILVTGGGAPGAPGIIKAIKSAHPDVIIYACDAQPDTAGKLLAHRYFTVPLGTDPAFSDTLLAQCKKGQIQAILPITTRELEPLSRSKDTFAKAGIRVIVSDLHDLTIANDKGKLYQHLSDNGIAVPQFGVATNYDEFLAIQKRLKTTESKYIVKPCRANGSRGFRIVDSSISKHDLLFNHKPNSTYITENELSEILQESFPPLLVSEYLPGQEYTVDCLVNKGTPLLIIPRSRDKMNAGISVAGRIENHPEIIAYCTQILATLNLHGPIGIQVKMSTKGQPLLVEINPRIQGTTVALQGAGVNIPSLCLSPDFNVAKLNDYPIKWGTQFVRHYEELYF